MVAEYAAVALLAAVGGAGIPGPGDAALLAAALLAADGHLTLAVVLVVAFVGALIGRAGAYAFGAKGGRHFLERPGWTHGLRSRVLTSGDGVFERFPTIAPLLAPAAVSGIYRVPLPVFVLASVAFTLGWTLATGLIGYYLGPAAQDVLNRIGLKGIIAVAVVAAIGLVYRYVWRYPWRRE